MLLTIRETAAKCSSIGVREALQRQADQLAEAINVFSNDRTETNLRWVNCMWVLAVRMLANVKPEPAPPTPPTATAEEQVRLVA